MGPSWGSSISGSGAATGSKSSAKRSSSVRPPNCSSMMLYMSMNATGCIQENSCVRVAKGMLLRQRNTTKQQEKRSKPVEKDMDQTFHRGADARVDPTKRGGSRQTWSQWNIFGPPQ